MEANSAQNGRVPELDGLRGLAIALVVLFHYFGAPLQHVDGPAAQFVWRTLRLGWSGVDLFFVLSGFLIAGILLDHRAAPRYFQTFYLRRAFRILPLYLVWVGLFFALPALFPSLPSRTGFVALFSSPMPAWSYLTFSQNVMMAIRRTTGAVWLGVTWSLAVEEHFYLALPCLVRWVPRRRFVACLAAIATLGLCARLLAGPSNFFVSYVLTPTHADSLIAGSLCAWALRHETWRRRLLRARGALHALVATMLVVLALASYFRHFGFEGSQFMFIVMAVFYSACLVLAVTPGGGPVAWLAGRRPLRALGFIAYGLYLCHEAMKHLFHGLLLAQPPGLTSGAQVAVSCAALLASCALSAAAWRVLERPLIAVGHRFHYGEPGADAVSPGID